MSAFEDIIASLPMIKQHHARQTSVYRVFEKLARQESEKLFDPKVSANPKILELFGGIYFPYIQMGSVSSANLFDLDELIIFSFYLVNRNRYRVVLDIGANIGLHTTILAKCGYEVTLFEPDPSHFAKLQDVIAANHLQKIIAYQAAVSDRAGKSEFVRVLGNTTSSHLAGCKQPYGEIEKFTVSVFDIRDLIRKFDLIKMDVEGHEAALIQATSGEDWNATDAMIEVGSVGAAQAIFNHLTEIHVRCFSQKTGWEEVHCLQDMPVCYKEGSLFISKKPSMLWTE